jgi:hypothetical protein
MLQQIDFGFASTSEDVTPATKPTPRAKGRAADWQRQLARAFLYVHGRAQTPEEAAELERFYAAAPLNVAPMKWTLSGFGLLVLADGPLPNDQKKRGARLLANDAMRRSIDARDCRSPNAAAEREDQANGF